MNKLMIGELQIGDIIIDSNTTVKSLENKNLNIKIREGKPNSYVYFLSPQSIFSEVFVIHLLFKDEKLSKIFLRVYSEIEEDGWAIAKRHRRWLIKLLGEEQGIKNQIKFAWGIINPWVDMRSGQSEIHITYL